MKLGAGSFLQPVWWGHFYLIKLKAPGIESFPLGEVEGKDLSWEGEGIVQTALVPGPHVPGAGDFLWEEELAGLIGAKPQSQEALGSSRGQ